MGFKVALVNRERADVPAWVTDELESNGIEFSIGYSITGEPLRTAAADADIVWFFHPTAVLTAEDLSMLPRCGAIIRTGSGTDKLPVKEATELGIVVANTPEAVCNAVSDHAVALLMAVVRDLLLLDRALRGGEWNPSFRLPRCVTGQVLGLVGFGAIAQQVARKMRGFEMELLVYDPYVSGEVVASYKGQPVELDALLQCSDFVSLHCPLTDGTCGMIGERELRLMKPTAFLINTSRGAVVDETALLEALTNGWIAGAGLDVFQKEPPDQENPLWNLDNVVVTPHRASAAVESVAESWRLSVETVLDLAAGRYPRSYVNREVDPRWKLV